MLSTYCVPLSISICMLSMNSTELKTDKRACFGTDFCNQLCLSGRNCSGYFLCSKNCRGLEMCRNVCRNLHWRYSKPDCYCNRFGLFERNTGSCKCSRLCCFHPIDGIPVCSSNAEWRHPKNGTSSGLTSSAKRRAGGKAIKSRWCPIKMVYPWYCMAVDHWFWYYIRYYCFLSGSIPRKLLESWKTAASNNCFDLCSTAQTNYKKLRGNLDLGLFISLTFLSTIGFAVGFYSSSSVLHLWWPCTFCACW